MLRELLKKFDQNFPLLNVKISERSEEINRNFAAGKLSFGEADYHSAKRIIILAKRDINPTALPSAHQESRVFSFYSGYNKFGWIRA